MADFTKLTAAVDANTASTDANTTAVNGLIAAHTSGTDQATIDDLAAKVAANTAKTDANNSAIDAALNPPVALSVSPTTLALTAGQPVTEQLTVTGGTAPYSFDAGTSGLSVDSAGAVTGSVAAAGDSTITVTDAAGGSVSVAVTAS